MNTYPDIKVNIKKLNDFIRNYQNSRYPQERLGQAFVNRFVEDKESYSELFYAEDDIALKLISKRHVQR